MENGNIFSSIEQDKCMRTRPEHDPFVSIKVPASIRRHLRLMAAKDNKCIYQVLADLIINHIESEKSSEAKAE